MQQGHAAWTGSMDMQREHVAWTSSIYSHGHAGIYYTSRAKKGKNTFYIKSLLVHTT
jgi:hypothetical protein